MTHFLQQVLKIKDPLFTIGLTSLEKSAGNSGVDTRLIADILHKAHKIMRTLGLDPKDTTGHELYHSLMAAVKHNDIEIESLLSKLDYVLFIIDGKVISFNLIDVIENSHHELSYDRQIISHGQRSLRGEIIGRYIDHARTNEKTTIDLACSIGLLPEQDAWYNNAKAYKKHTVKITEES